ncbi:MAG: EamA family transporter [Saprospiraceae bacterium]|nr:EamA family transporter [Saprospiraceae bacterium]
MNNTQRAYLELHFAVLLWGFTAILGQLIQLSSLSLVWWRVFITCLFILLTSKTWSNVRRLPRRLVGQYIGIGCIVVIHWLTFYGAVKLANASVALICMATTSFFSSILEPFILQKSVKWYEVTLGLVIIPAMVFIAGTLPEKMTLGLMVGLISAFLVTVFSILNKKMVNQTDPLSITLLELSGGWLFLSLLLPFYFQFDKTAILIPPSVSDWFYLLILALLCTNLGYWIGIRTLRHLSAFASNLTINLEPVYGIVLAVLILKENRELSPSFYLGAIVILAAVLSYPFLKNKFE